MNNFSGYRWWEQKSEPYRESCRKKAIQETVELKGKFDYFIKKTRCKLK
jgi:hypothetical protein